MERLAVGLPRLAKLTNHITWLEIVPSSLRYRFSHLEGTCPLTGRVSCPLKRDRTDPDETVVTYLGITVRIPSGFD